jgi:hypothetical protein
MHFSGVCHIYAIEHQSAFHFGWGISRICPKCGVDSIYIFIRRDGGENLTLDSQGQYKYPNILSGEGFVKKMLPTYLSEQNLEKPLPLLTV